MRFKNINIDRSSKTFSAEYGKVLSDISVNLNNIGEMFDKIASFENFVLKDISTDLENLIKIRTLKDEIIEKGSSEIYISKYFKPAVDKLNEKIQISVSSWDQQEEEKPNGKMKIFVDGIKNLYYELNNCTNDENCVLQQSIKNIIELFSNFKVYHALICNDPVKKIEILISLKEDFSYVGENIELPKQNKITIDDL